MFTFHRQPGRVKVTRVLGVLEPGGAQLSALRLSRAQAALGVRTKLLVGDATPEGVALARYHGIETEAFAMSPRVHTAARQWAPDSDFATWLEPRLRTTTLVHAHMFGAWWAAAQVMPRHVPLVASEHNAISWPLGDHRAAAREAAARVSRFFAHGPAAWAFALELGISALRVLPGRSALALATHPRPGLVSPRLTFTGRLREDKGPDLLLHALAAMSDPPHTYVVGDGPMQPELRRLVRALGLQGVVHLPGWSNEPSRYVAGAAVHVVPSREEAWSQSAVTALALGVPVVGTAVDGLSVTLAHRRGVLVQPEPAALASGIAAVLAGSTDLDREGARAYAASFSPERIASDYFAVYQGLCGDRSGQTEFEALT